MQTIELFEQEFQKELSSRGYTDIRLEQQEDNCCKNHLYLKLKRDEKEIEQTMGICWCNAKKSISEKKSNGYLIEAEYYINAFGL